jgi:hypothetical protein
MRVLSLLLSPIVLVVMLSPSAGAACGNVEFPPMDNEAIGNQFSAAVIRIEAKGTGFVVDAKQGYVLTADHVIRGAKKEFLATTEAGTPVTLVLIKSLFPAADVALLRAVPDKSSWDTPLSSVTPIDVSMRAPPSGASVFAMGYSRSEQYISRQAGTLQTIRKGQLVVQTAPFPGDSGGPLFSKFGVAIGIAIDRLSPGTALYTPMDDALELLKLIPPSDNIAGLDKRVRAREIAEDDLTLELRPRYHPTSVTNVELVSWAARIHSDISSYARVKAVFNCPIVPAYSQRFLETVSWSLLRGVMPDEAKAETAQRLADNENALGRELQAKQYESVAQSSAASWVVQVTGDSSETSALARYRQLQEKHEALLGPYEPVVIRTVLSGGAQRTWSRVQVKASSREAGELLCSQLRAAGESCLLQRSAPVMRPAQEQ